MKTYPQNSDYSVESGAARNFEPWRKEDEVGEEEQRKRDAEEMGDAMKSLENRTLDSKREMDILSALDEMKSMKSRHAHVSVDSMLEALQRSAPTCSGDGIVVKGKAYGVPSIRVDGNDALAVYTAVYEARKMAIEKQTPVLI